MKKFLSMFAFVAALVLGALSCTSCSSSDDDDDKKEPTYKFKMELTFDTENEATKQNYSYTSMTNNLKRIFEESDAIELTEKEALDKWERISSSADEMVISSLQAAIISTGDYTIKATLVLLKNGEIFQRKVYSAK